MPNWSSNTIRITGKKEEIDRLEAFVKSETSEFDFERIIPMPVELKGTTSPNNNKNKQSALLKEKYGADNWYDWSIINWGTKWNANYVSKSRKGSLMYELDTAWSPPLPVITELAKEFPELTISIKYYECGMGFSGEYKVKGREVLVDKFSNGYRGQRGG